MTAGGTARMSGDDLTGVLAAGLDTARDLARSYEPDRYLAALLAPRPTRTALIIVAAFAGELTRITRLTGEPLLGEIRLQWWRDVLGESLDGSLSGNPLADAMRAVIAQHNLPAHLIDAVVDAGAARLHGQTPATLIDLTNGLAASQGALFEIVTRIISPAKMVSSNETTKAAGIAYGLARLVDDLPQSLARGENPLPQDLQNKYGVTPAMLAITDPPSRQLVKLLQHLHSQAQQHLRLVSDQLCAISLRERAAFLPLATVGPYLQNSMRNDDRSYAAHTPLLPHRRVWHIWRLHRTGRIR